MLLFVIRRRTCVSFIKEEAFLIKSEVGFLNKGEDGH